MPLGITKYETRGRLPQRKVADGFDLEAEAGSALDGGGTGGTGGTGGQDSAYSWTNLFGGSGGSSAAATKNAETARLKYEADLAAGEASTERLKTGAAAQAAYLRNLLGQGVPASITGEIGAQETAGRSYINTQAQNLLERLAGALGTGQQFTTQGYDTLRNYLTANPAQAYAQAQRAVPTVTNNALAQYMQAQGVDPAMAQPAVDQANQQALGGATNYNQLLNVLSGAEASGQASRMSEEQMARALAGSQLQQTYGAGRANVESEQLSALNDLATRISNARIAAQEAQTAQEQAIERALAAIYGTGYTAPPGSTGGGTTGGGTTDGGTPPPSNEPTGGGVKQTAVQALQAIPVKASNKALQKRIDDFVAAKPNASAAAVAKAFPQLAATLAKKK